MRAFVRDSGFDPELTLGPLIGCKTLVMLAVSALPIRYSAGYRLVRDRGKVPFRLGSRRAAFPQPDNFKEQQGGVSMRTLASLLATAALVGGVTIASAQQSGSPTAPSGPVAGGASSPNTTPQGARGTQRIETTGQATTTKKGAKKGAKTAPKPPPGSGSPTAPSGPGAGGAKPPGQ
jgi:hypothetical protein